MQWKLSVDAQSPHNPTATWRTGFTSRTIDLLISKGHMARLARARLAEEVLQAPDSIIQRWGREKDDCLIYVGTPSRDYRSSTVETPPPHGMLFLVFVLPDGTIDDWSWRPAEAGEPGMPEGMKGKVVWPAS
jgi:hypothetical protein